MITYIIVGPTGLAGVADYPDEAIDFAIRITGLNRDGVNFTDAGAMYCDDRPTGWYIAKTRVTR